MVDKRLEYEFVYKLDLPPLSAVINQDFASQLQQDLDSEWKNYRHMSEKISNAFKPEFTTICGIDFSTVITFYKKDFTGRIHTDINCPNFDIWGINWIYGGQGIMEYWTRESIGCDSIKLMDTQGGKIEKWNKDFAKPPLKIYSMPPGAYLVNASEIHRVTAFGKRHAIVIRPKRDPEIKWQDAINAFRPLINGVPHIMSEPVQHVKFIE